MVPDRQKVRTDGRNGQADGRTDDAKTISLRLRRGIKKSTVNNKIRQIYPACKIIILQKHFVLISTYTLVCYDHSDSAGQMSRP